MSGYQTKSEVITVDDISLNITSLLDKNQFYDPEDIALNRGISSSMWPISGLVWPSGVVLAKVVSRMDLAGLRVLEVGCGIAVASLVAAYKSADITASDFHPLVETFLKTNMSANKIEGVAFDEGDWNYPDRQNGKFDLIIGSDLLYDHGHSELLSCYLDAQLSANGKILLIDPGRRAGKKIKSIMQALDYQCDRVKMDNEGKIKKEGYFTQYTFTKPQPAV